MKYVGVVISLLACSTGALSAWYWYKSSRVSIVPIWADKYGVEPGDQYASQSGQMAGVIRAASESGRLNKIAALLTAVTVALNVIGGVVGVWTS